MSAALTSVPVPQLVNLPRWYEDREHVQLLAEYLVSKNYITSVKTLLRFYETPWKWSLEWERFEKEELSK